jgi:hypothetical protein
MRVWDKRFKILHPRDFWKRLSRMVERFILTARYCSTWRDERLTALQPGFGCVREGAGGGSRRGCGLAAPAAHTACDCASCVARELVLRGMSMLSGACLRPPVSVVAWMVLRCGTASRLAP